MATKKKVKKDDKVKQKPGPLDMNLKGARGTARKLRRINRANKKAGAY